MSNTKHYLAAILSFVIWGFFSIPLQWLKAYSVGEILYFRILFSSLVLLVIILGFKRNDLKTDWTFLQSFPGRQRMQVITLTLTGGVLLTINWLTFIYTVNNINVKTASFAYLICPVIAAVLGSLLLKERLTPLQWVAVALCAMSCMLMGINSALELGYSFLTALSYALYLVSQRKNQGFDRMIVLGIQVLFSFLILNTFYTSLIREVPASIDFYMIILIIAAVFTVVPLFLNLFALNRINSATIGILMYLTPIFNFGLALTVFGETINAFQLFGFSLIVVALILFNLSNFRRVQIALTEKLAPGR